MNRCIVGIDLGTSSVKIIKKYEDGHIEKLKNTYENPLPLGWWNSILKLLEEIDWREAAAIGLCSQVGTYLVNDKDVLPWNGGMGKEELHWWKTNYSQEKFVEEISMPHPYIISYPLPRLKYIKEHYNKIQKICQPKEYILEKLTGQWVTDAYSWRGLANLEWGKYSHYFLQQLSLEETMLPPIKRYDEMAGYTKEIAFGKNVLPAGIPVYVGLNDYYAGLLGMGIGTVGEMFDVTGTSEHLGILQEKTQMDTALVSGPYLEHMVHYGVTASSGSSIKYGLKLMQQPFDLEKITQQKPPVFLPYLKGERAPIWDADARGVFFGMEEDCSLEQMAYSVMEGVVFSLYHIYETMGKPEMNKLVISGGAADIDCLNLLKSELFGVPVEIVEESDVSALGACMTAAVGMGFYQNYQQITKEWVKRKQGIFPTGRYKEWLEQRFEIYKELYFSLKPLYQKWKKL